MDLNLLMLPVAGKTVREPGDLLVTDSFTNTLLDSCCVCTTGILMFLSVILGVSVAVSFVIRGVSCTVSVGRAISVFLMIMSRS
jgi:hypothetical protein